MHSKKFINTYTFLGVIVSVCAGNFFWGWIDIGYVKEFEIASAGEYAKFKYNPINEIVRYVTFITLPLIVYLICIKIFRGRETKEIKEIFFYDNSKNFYVTKNSFQGLRKGIKDYIKDEEIKGTSRDGYMDINGKPTGGGYEIACAQLCGNSHYRMRGFLTVESDEDYAAFLEEEAEYLDEEDDEDW